MSARKDSSRSGGSRRASSRDQHSLRHLGVAEAGNRGDEGIRMSPEWTTRGIAVDPQRSVSSKQIRPAFSLSRERAGRTRPSSSATSSNWRRDSAKSEAGERVSFSRGGFAVAVSGDEGQVQRPSHLARMRLTRCREAERHARRAQMRVRTHDRVRIRASQFRGESGANLRSVLHDEGRSGAARGRIAVC